MNELTSSERKFIKKLLKEKIVESKRQIDSSFKSFQDKNYPNFTEEVHMNNFNSKQKIINQCVEIFDKL